jgi:GT2 family glycosyltransferase
MENGRQIGGVKTISVVIPARNGGLAFRDCVASLVRCRHQFLECIVVDDGSTDESIKYAEEQGFRIIRVGVRSGPANARNLGALAATGDILLFLDADVSINDFTISAIVQRFEADPSLGALFGSYDTTPAARGLVSEYRNLLHTFIHHTSKRHASTFWSGCGAIKREIFQACGGFDVSYAVPCVEDIELGMRLVRDGIKVELDPQIQVKHLKRWTLRGMVETDVKYRGIPWARLILASHKMPNDLNLRWSSRLSVILVATLCLGAALLAGSFVGGAGGMLLWPLLFGMVVTFACVAALNMPFYRFLAARRSFKFATASILLHLVYLLCCGTAMAVAVGLHCWSVLVVRSTKVSVASAGHRVE